MKYLEELDADRISSLFAALKPENEVATRDKIAFWSALVEQELGAGTLGPSKISFNCSKLQLFQVNGLTPLCLDDVISNMVDSTTIQKRSEIGDSGYISTFYKILSGWLAASPVYTTSQVEFVHLKAMEKYAVKIMSLITDNLMEQKAFEMLCNTAGLTNTSDMQLVQARLIQSKQLLVKEKGALTVLKFKTTELQPISVVDVGRVSLRKMEFDLLSQIEELELNMNKLRDDTKVYIKEGNKTRAMYNLKKKKGLEAVLTARLGSLDTITNIMDKMTSAETESQILNAYSIGSSALRNLLDSKELNIERVESTMDELAEVLADQNEIENLMAMPDLGLEDEDIQLELNELILAEEESTSVSAIAKELEELEVLTSSLPAFEENAKSAEVRAKEIAL